MGDGSDILSGLQSFSQNGSAAGNMVGLGLALTGNAPSAQTNAIREKALQDIQSAVDRNGGNISRGVIEWAKSPQATAAHRIPGAIEDILSKYKDIMTPIPPVSTGVGAGQTGVIQQAGQPAQGVTPAPQVTNTPPGEVPNIARPGQNGQPGTVSQGPRNPTTEVQNFSDLTAISNLPEDVKRTMAGFDAGRSDMAKGQAMFNYLRQNGVPEQFAQNFVLGNLKIMQDPKIPGRFYLQDTINDPAHIHVLPVEGLPQVDSINPNYANPNPRNPSSYSSSPVGGNPNASPQPQSNAPQPQSNAPGPLQNNKVAAETAKKYNTIPEAVKPDGTIDPVKAWGPQATLALGGGLPALVQNTVGHISRWFDPSQTNEASQAISDAEQGLAGLEYLSTGLAEGSRVRKMVDAAIHMGPEHEKWNDPQYASGQLIRMRQLLEMEAKNNQEEISAMMQEGTSSDNANMSDLKKKNTAIKQVLTFLPSTGSLQDMNRAIQDHKIANVPSVATAGKTAADVASTAVTHGARAVGLTTGRPEEFNKDPQAAITQISRMSLTQLDKNGILKMYPKLDPVIQRAIDDRINKARVPVGGPSQYAPAPQAPAQNTFGGRPVKNVKTKPNNPLSNFNPDLTPNADRVDNAFRALGQ